MAAVPHAPLLASPVPPILPVPLALPPGPAVTVALLAVVAAVALGTLVGPLYAVPRLRDVRPPTDAERATIDDLRAAGGLDVGRVRVVASDAVDVAVRGPPGRRALFVSEATLDLDRPAAVALFAAAAGRVGLWYAEFRALAVGVVVGLAAAVFGTVLPFDRGFAALGAVAMVAFAVGRRLQYAADARAAERVGADRLADAFERAAARRGVDPPTGSWRTYFEIQPPLGDRIARLRERDE